MTYTTVGMEYDRVPPQEWQAALDRLFPRMECLTWLELAWFPGEPEDPVERWVIRQMIPEDYILPEMRRALRGPHPRTLGHRDKTGKWVSEAYPGLTSYNWHAYRRTRCEARLFWIIQGSYGGHRYVATPNERKVRRMLKVSPDTPAPGLLPYAEFDWRVAENLLEQDQVRTWFDMLLRYEKRPEDFAQREKQQMQDLRKAVLKWVEDQTDEMVDSRASRWWAHARTDAPKGSDDCYRNFEIEQEQFITDEPATQKVAPKSRLLVGV